MPRAKAQTGPGLFDVLEREAAKEAAITEALRVERDVLGRRAYRGPRKGWTKNAHRLHEIEKVIRHRHGGGACDTDDGEVYLRAAAPHLRKLAAEHSVTFYESAAGFCQALLPRLARSTGPDLIEMLAEDREACRLLKADAIAGVLGVTFEERTTLGLRTIGAVDRSKRQRTLDRKKRDAAYQAAKRAAAGATPRSASKVAAAAALGMSLATYKRRLKAGLLPSQPPASDPISSAIVRSTYPSTTRPGQPMQAGASRSPILGNGIQTVQGSARTGGANQSLGAGGHSPRSIPKVVRTAVPLPPPLPEGRGSMQPDLLDEPQRLGALVTDLIATYTGGILPALLIATVRDQARAKMLRQVDVARQIGISRPQLANALQGRFGLSAAAASNLKTWLAAGVV